MRTYRTVNNLGLARYSVSFHDGEKRHADGSPFHDLRLFSNKRKMDNFIASLKRQGYRQE